MGRSYANGECKWVRVARTEKDDQRSVRRITDFRSYADETLAVRTHLTSLSGTDRKTMNLFARRQRVGA